MINLRIFHIDKALVAINKKTFLVFLDGKHIAIRAKKTDGSFYYNYKGFNSIILLAFVDANYKFVFVDVGTNGRANDAAVFNQSQIGFAVSNDQLNFPENKELPGTNTKV